MVLAAGFSLKVTQGLMGHASFAITADTSVTLQRRRTPTRLGGSTPTSILSTGTVRPLR